MVEREARQAYAVVKTKFGDDGSRFIHGKLYQTPEEAYQAEALTKAGDERSTYISTAKVRWKE